MMTQPWTEKEKAAISFVEGILGCFCAYHGNFEIYDSESRMCGECWHIYYRPINVELAYELEWGEFRPAEEIPACPYCLHDW